MASVLQHGLLHVVVIVLCVGLLLPLLVVANSAVTSTTTTTSCPQHCMCLGNIADCSASQIIRLPSDLRDCPWIEQLKLNGNPGLNLSSSDLPLLPHLTVLELKKLGLLVFPELGRLPRLTNLSLRDNELSKVGSLEDLPGLKNLDLSRNSLTVFPAHFKLPNIKKLNLDRNRLSSVSGNGAGLSTLLELRLVRNFVTEAALLNSGLLNNLPALTMLNLNNNRLHQLPGLMFQNCSSLRFLKLSRNKINLLGDGVFYGLKNLTSLSLDQNNLTVVSNTWLFGLDGLKELSLRHNAINVVTPNAFSGTTLNLLSLDLSYNNLVSLHASLLKGLDKLEYLQLAQNRLSTIGPATFTSTPSLLQLDLSENDLRWSIEDGGDSYVGLSNLQKLDLSLNKIEAIQYTALAPMTSLMKLDLRGNDIRTLHDNPFRNIDVKSGDNSQILLNTSSIVCDCHLAWLQKWIKTTKLDLTGIFATCSYPPDKVGKQITQLKEENLSCTLSPRPVIQRSPEDRIVLRNSDVELSCEALVGSRGGEPIVLWRRDNQLIEPYKLEKKMNVERPDPSGGVISKLTSVLHLSSVAHEDAGKYQCVVRNNFGAVYSDQALIEVQVKPYFTVPPRSINVHVGDGAKLECAAEGLPPPEISLQKGGNDYFPAAGERRLIFDPEATVFFIKPVTIQDEGLYTCTANSTAGIARASANITVAEAPYFLQSVHDATVLTGETAVMHCQGSGRPMPSISWVRNGQVISSSSNRFKSVEGGSFLIVSNVSPADQGHFTCQLTNTYGTRRQTMHLTVFDGMLMDGHTIILIVMSAVVLCALLTLLVFIGIIHRRKKGYPKPTKSLLGQYPRSPPSSPHHEYILPANHTPMVTDPMLAEDPSRCTDVATGPDTGSEHSTGKDSGVGDSSQRSSEDLRLLHNNGAATVANSGINDFIKQTTPSHSTLMVYADQGNLPAIVRGGSSLSVATDGDARYDDYRPRLSTFGNGGSATLRRPSSHRPIPALGPCLARNHTTTLPHNHSFKTRGRIQTDANNAQLNTNSTSEEIKNGDSEKSVVSSNSQPRSVSSTNPHSSNQIYSQFNNHYKDTTSPYSRPNNKVLSDKHPNMLQNRHLSPLASPQYMSAKCITSDAVSDSNWSEANPQYVSSTSSTTDDGQPIYGSNNNRLESPQYMPTTGNLSTRSCDPHQPISVRSSLNNENPIYKDRHELGISRLSSSQTRSGGGGDYSTPSIAYSVGNDDVEIGGQSPSVPPPPPQPPSKFTAASHYDCAPLLTTATSSNSSSNITREPSAPR